MIDERCFKIGRPRGNLTFFSLILSYYQCNHSRVNARFFPFSSSKLEHSHFFIWLIPLYTASLCTPIATPNPPSGFICNLNLLAPIISFEGYGFFSFFFLYTGDLLPNNAVQLPKGLMTKPAHLFIINSHTLWFCLCIFFLILFYFQTLQHCISFAKHRNESATAMAST